MADFKRGTTEVAGWSFEEGPVPTQFDSMFTNERVDRWWCCLSGSGGLIVWGEDVEGIATSQPGLILDQKTQSPWVMCNSESFWLMSNLVRLQEIARKL